MSRGAWGLLLLGLAVGCGGSGGSDAGLDGSAGRDAGPPAPPVDAGEVDAGSLGDAGSDDAGSDDASVALDASLPDAGADAGAPVACEEPGATETVPCGRCGTAERFCTADRVWIQGTCEGEPEDACTPGETSAEACGDCGTQATFCNASCARVPMGACTDEGECAVGERVRTGDGCAGGSTRELLCNASCAYDEVEACRVDGCSPGAVQDVACGMCGTQERFCDASRVWQYEPCEGEGECAPGATGSAACGMCGTASEVCSASCEWEPDGACMDEGVCAPGERETTSAGCPSGQTRVLECDAGCGLVEVESCSMAACSFPGTACAAAEVCACPSSTHDCSGTGTCRPLSGSYVIEIDAATLPSMDPAGLCWDGPGCGLPDPYVVVRVGASAVGTTSIVDNTLTPTWGVAARFPGTLSSGTVVTFVVFDSDIAFDDDAFTCSITLDDGALRARDFTCRAGTGQTVSGAFIRTP